MEGRAKKLAQVTILSLLGLFVAGLVCVQAFVGRRTICHFPVDRSKLKVLHTLILQYYMDYGRLLAPAEFKTRLVEDGYTENGEEFYIYSSKTSRVEIRYFVNGDDFLLVAPGPNGRYDTPEDYEALENLKETGDDRLESGTVRPRKKRVQRPQ